MNLKKYILTSKKLNYIHQNPVIELIVVKPEDYYTAPLVITLAIKV